MKHTRKIVAGLVALCIVPVVAGAARVHEVLGGAAVTPDNARFLAAPVSVVLHILSISLFGVLGAFQFVPSLRSRASGWHRVVGWGLIPAAFGVALTGLWMTLTYPWPAIDGLAVYLFRLAVAAWMLVSLVMAIRAIVRRDFSAHGAWMTRAYAIAMGAGTQVLTHLPLLLLEDRGGMTWRAVAMGGAWLFNAAVAEWVIHGSRGAAVRMPVAAASTGS